MCAAERTTEKSKDSKKIRVALDQEKVLEFLKLNFFRLNELTDRLGMSEEDNAAISSAVSNVIGIPHRNS